MSDQPLDPTPLPVQRPVVDQGYQAYAPPPGLDLTLTKQQRGQIEGVKSRAARKLGREEGFEDALESFIPHVLTQIQASQELMPKVMALLTAAVESLNDPASEHSFKSEDIKNITPLAAKLMDEQKRIIDRLIGSSVQRTQQDITKTVTNVNLRDLLKQRSGPASLEGEVVK